MNISWKFKSILLFLAVVLSVYFLIPTFMGLKEKRVALEKSGESLPWYHHVLPQDELNLGLDLQGGLYMELEVDIEEALGHHLHFLAGDIQRYLDDDFEGIVAASIPGDHVRVQVKKGELEKAQLEVRKFFGGDQITFLNSAEPTQDQSFTVSEDKEVFYLGLSDDYVENFEKDIIEQAANSVRNRIDRFGVAEAGVSRQGKRLVVELPGVKDPDRIIDIVKRTGKLEFRLVSEAKSVAELNELVTRKQEEWGLTKEYQLDEMKKLNEALKADLPQETEVVFQLRREKETGKLVEAVPFLLETKAEVTGDMLENASVQSQNNLPYVSMTFNKVGAKKFGDLTSANVGKQLAIVLDDVVMSSPVIKSAITGGQAQIELGFGRYDVLQKEAKELVLILKEGALPASLSVATKNVIGPSLGRESIELGLKSMWIATLVIVIFMILYYKVGGLIANMALVLNVLFIFAILCLFQASLTLPGIAGIVLTMGMAVDANVIIFERMREERYLGKNAKAIVDSGYSNAMSAILDGNVTTFIAGLVLFEFGTGPIKGFATTLMIGIVTTLVTAIIITRTAYDWMTDGLQVQSIRI